MECLVSKEKYKKLHTTKSMVNKGEKIQRNAKGVLIHDQLKDVQPTSKSAEKHHRIAYWTTQYEKSCSTWQRIANKTRKSERNAKGLLIEQKRRETLKEWLLSKHKHKDVLNQQRQVNKQAKT